MELTIINTLVTDIDPDIQEKNAMNRINAADREKIGFEFEEAQELELLQKQKQKERNALQGQGIADREKKCQRVSGKCRCTKQSWYQLSRSICLNGYTALRYLQAIGAETNI
jgi:hypothetical protein